jgi:hypothetical protein
VPLTVITDWLRRARDAEHARLTALGRDALKAIRPRSIAIDIDEES